MGRSLRASQEGIKRAKIALTDKTWRREDLVAKVEVSRSTVMKFFSGKPVDSPYFVLICQALALNWQEIAESHPTEQESNRCVAVDVVKTRLVASSPSTLKENIPLSGAVKFVGREESLYQLHQLLQENDQVAIAGMGGVGKTELAIQYAKAYLDDYPGGVCWLFAKVGDVGTQVVAFARKYFPDFTIPDGLTLADQVEFCWQHWLTPPSPPPPLTPPDQGGDRGVLVVLDDVTDYRLVKLYLPPVRSRFKVLITTRQRLGHPIQLLPLDVLDADAALELLSQLTDGRCEQQPDVAHTLCGWLGYLPLGLELVGRYLEQDPDLSLEKMLNRLQQKKLKHPAVAAADSTMTAELGVAAAFELSWGRLSTNAQLLGCLLSIFAPAPMPWQLVESVVERFDRSHISLDLDDLEAARRELLQLHLLERTGEGTYPLHQLIREFLREKLDGLDSPQPLLGDTVGEFGKPNPPAPSSEEGEKEKLLFLEGGAWKPLPDAGSGLGRGQASGELTNRILGEGLGTVLKRSLCQAIVAVAKQIPDTPTRQLISLLTPAMPHVAEAATTLTNFLSDDDLIAPFIGLGSFYAGQGFYNQAAPWFEQCLSIARTRLGEEHPDVATTLNNLANLYDSQGRYSEAEPLYPQALELRQRLLGKEHPAVAQSLNNLANLYCSQGRYSEAEPLYLQALELRQRLLGKEHPAVAQSWNNLARLYDSQGRYAEAEPLYLLALEQRRHLLGSEHPDVASTLNNLALLYHSQGRYAEAEPLYMLALEQRQRLLGSEHPDVAQSLNNLASLYRSQGRYSKAELLYVQALELRQRFLGSEHPSVATTLNNLASLYKSQGRYNQAESLYVQALELRKSLLGSEHPDVASTLNNLANLYDAQGRYDQAESLYIEALELRQRLLGQEHPSVASTLNNLARLYEVQGRYGEAEALHLQALELRRRLLGSEHPDVAFSLNNLANLYDSQGLYDRAESLYVEALELRQRLLGSEHPDVASTLNNLALLYHAQGRYAEAESLHLQALELWQRFLGDEHPDVASSLNNLGLLYHTQGQYSEAEDLHLQALELRRNLLGNAHPDIAFSLNNLANLYASQGRYKEAEPLYVEALDIFEQRLGENHSNTVTVRKTLEILRTRFDEVWDDNSLGWESQEEVKCSTTTEIDAQGTRLLTSLRSAENFK
jgi:tetratricopeptide (TPR) repeat protein